MNCSNNLRESKGVRDLSCCSKVGKGNIFVVNDLGCRLNEL